MGFFFFLKCFNIYFSFFLFVANTEIPSVDKWSLLHIKFLVWYLFPSAPVARNKDFSSLIQSNNRLNLVNIVLNQKEMGYI